MNILKFTEMEKKNDTVKDMLAEGIELTKFSMNKHYGDSKLIPNYGLVINDYKERNEVLRENILKYAMDRAGIAEEFRGNFTMVAANPMFTNLVFTMISEVIDSVNTKVEIEEAMRMAEVRNLAEGDSSSFEIGSKSLYKVEDVGYSNNTSPIQQHFMDNITVLPRRKQAKIAYDLYQLNTSNYDFGKQMAKLAVSFRAQMHKDIIDLMYTVSLIATPFYKATFSAQNLMEVADKVGGVNGGKATMFGTKRALNNTASTIDAKWTQQVTEEYVKTGIIGDVYGVPSVVIDQAYDPSSSSYTEQVPNDRVLLMSTGVDKPCKLVMEGNTSMIIDDGSKNTIGLRTYQVTQAWEVALASDAVHGAITVS